MLKRCLLVASALLSVAPFLSAQNPAPAGPISYVTADAAQVPNRDASWGAATSMLGDSSVSSAPRFWATAEYLIWFTRNQNSPALLISVPDSLVNLGARLPAGASVTNLYPSNRKIEFDAQSGGRVVVGYSFNETIGIDFSGFVLESQSDGGTFTSPGSPSLARTYTRAAGNDPQILYSALPGQYPGQVRIFTDTQLWGMDSNIRVDWYRMLADSNDLLAGFRFLDLQESLIINDRSDLPDGTINTVVDAFRTHNKFYGGQIGLHTQLMNYGGLSLEMVNKFAIGGVHQRVQAFGANTLTGQPTQATGLLVQQANSGIFERDKFAAVGEFTLNLGYFIRSNVRVHVGYNLLWQSSVVRPAQAIDPVLNDSNIRFIAGAANDTTSRRPRFDFSSAASDFWAQGLNLGLTIVY